MAFIRCQIEISHQYFLTVLTVQCWRHVLFKYYHLTLAKETFRWNTVLSTTVWILAADLKLYCLFFLTNEFSYVRQEFTDWNTIMYPVIDLIIVILIDPHWQKGNHWRLVSLYLFVCFFYTLSHHEWHFFIFFWFTCFFSDFMDCLLEIYLLGARSLFLTLWILF